MLFTCRWIGCWMAYKGTTKQQQKKVKNNIMIIIKLYVVVLSIVLRFFRCVWVCIKILLLFCAVIIIWVFIIYYVFTCHCSFFFWTNPAWIGCEFCHIISVVLWECRQFFFFYFQVGVIVIIIIMVIMMYKK